VYEQAVDRESAFEKLVGRAAGSSPAATTGKPGEAASSNESSAGGFLGQVFDLALGGAGPRGGRREGLAQTELRSAMRSVGSAVGREIVRGVLGSLLGGGKRR